MPALRAQHQPNTPPPAHQTPPDTTRHHRQLPGTAYTADPNLCICRFERHHVRPTVRFLSGGKACVRGTQQLKHREHVESFATWRASPAQRTNHRRSPGRLPGRHCEQIACNQHLKTSLSACKALLRGAARPRDIWKCLDRLRHASTPASRPLACS